MPINFIIVGNSENRRVGFFQQALERCGLEPATVVSYSDLIAGRDTLEQFNKPNTIIRFDSPEKNFEVEKALIAAGADVLDAGNHQRISAVDAMRLEFDKGRILYPRQLYLGWRHLLHQWGNQLRCSTMNHPVEIAQMFDKPLCHKLFEKYATPYLRVEEEKPAFSPPSPSLGEGGRGGEGKIPVPRSLGVIRSYDELRQAMQSQNCSRVFVKLSHGSSASGVVAYQANPRYESAITTVERVQENGENLLYNSRRIRNYTRREEITDIINILCKEGVQVEAWLPKARLQNQPFDLRVVVIDGEAQHVVVRLGKSPMTNLHLGSDRAGLDLLLTQVKLEDWEVMKRTCETVAAVFPNSLYSGIDLLVYPDFRRHAILEINAFGDLLPGTTWNGLDTYTSEVKAILKKAEERENCIFNAGAKQP
ncbi:MULTISPECIES: STM4014 family protein [unclassified Coleofasciculus]|uniref:STM4014 family protein n=1 Tax=unclassified Coleofasciculus TaxID=2692782 RepID=UPI00187F491A|nr:MULTISPECIES: STM4014 family protein [unclassified Coleofasciculus]MBE9128464.1 STM4014 family protein [Coleofasciculus sp. LEGE 07081]MBE9149277.1 STM4014 family protein [Coleofasciculus sp. LEGE 07092]